MANYTILLIDYEPRSIERFRDPLTGAGYAVEIATDGVSGIEAFHRLNPDMVLVEAMIPKKHGFEVCQELKRTPHGRRTPVIITTGVYKGRKYRTQALHIYGCDEYIEKPIAAEQLLEVVGKFFGSGPSGAPKRSTETEPTGSESDGGSSSRGHGRETASAVPSADARRAGAGPSKPIAVPVAVVSDDTENEIMARLDQIMPGELRDSSPSVEPEAIAVVDTADQNPFAQMRAELDAELGAISGPLAFEMSPNLAPVPEAFPSDQAASPSVLDALPIPLSGIAPHLSEPATIPTAKEEQPGQIVDFDTKRNRKNRKAEKTRKAGSKQSAQVVVGPKSTGHLAFDPPVRVAEVTLPRGTIVASELESAPAGRGKPVALWLGAGAVALVALYLLFPRGATTQESTEATTPAASSAAPSTSASDVTSVPPSAAPTAEAGKPAAPVAPPLTTAGANAAVPGPEPQPIAALSVKPAPAAVKPPAAKKPADRAPVTATPPPTSASRTPSLPPSAPSSGTTTNRQPEATAPPTTTTVETTAPQEEAQAPAAPDNSAGVETVPDPASAAAASPATGIAPGTLIPIDEADSLPVSLTHRPPIYSLQARQLKIAGAVIMNVLVNDRGYVDQVVLVSGVEGGDVNEAAMRAARSWTYRPATKDGVPVKVWKSEKIVFKL